MSSRWQRRVYNNSIKTKLKQLYIHYLNKVIHTNTLSLLLLFAFMIKIRDITTKSLCKIRVKMAK